MLPLTRSRNRSRFFPPFSPASLFSAGEQGAWYDPSDLTTLFTDSAGTTPVTAVEQFVGLMLDKSKGLVLGPELVTTAPLNGTVYPFSTFTTSGTLITSAINSPGSSVAGAYWDLGSAIPIGTTLRVNLTIAVNGVPYNTFFGVGVNTSGAPSISSNNFRLTTSGTYSFFLTITGANARYLTIGQDAAPFNFAITAISVKQIAGNHATSTGTKRPKLAARYNLLTRTEEFDNGVWGKSDATVTANTVVAPDGTLTADKLIESATNTYHGIYQAITTGVFSYTFSVYAKAAERNWLAILQSPANRWAYFDLSTGTVGNTSAGVVATIASMGNGWYRCTITYTATAAGSNHWLFTAASNGSGFQIYTGDGTSGIYIWGADLRPASQATGLIGPTYQRVVDAATYDTAGYLPYLSFDGIDDSMSTGSIDFTATDKMTVWAGVRKLSDAVTAVLNELSADSNSNTGAFNVIAPNGAAANYAWLSRGSLTPGALTVTSYAAPITNVLTGIGNISGDQEIIRINGAQAGTNTNDQGTGNYGNYPLNIGARNNSSLFFQGWLTSLIVRGAQSTQSQIEATEAWVNQRTGAF